MIKDHSLVIFFFIIQYSIGAPQCQRVITYEEIQQLLVHSPCAMDADRIKRASDTGSSNRIYALKSTVNDHRTIIDDHRTMINYLMNNTVNITQLNQHFAEQHMKRSPIWNSWRDVSIIFLLVILISMFIYHLVVQIKTLEILTTFFVRRHQNKQTHQRRADNNKAVLHRDASDLAIDMRY